MICLNCKRQQHNTDEPLDAMASQKDYYLNLSLKLVEKEDISFSKYCCLIKRNEINDSILLC